MLVALAVQSGLDSQCPKDQPNGYPASARPAFCIQAPQSTFTLRHARGTNVLAHSTPEAFRTARGSPAACWFRTDTPKRSAPRPLVSRMVARQRPRTPFRRATVFLNDPRTGHAHPLGPECPRQLPLPVPVPIPLPKRVLSRSIGRARDLRKFLLKNGLDRSSDVLPQPVLERIIAGVIGQ